MSIDERWLLTDEEREAKGMGPWTQMDDPAHLLLTDEHESKPVVHDSDCYICLDPEFAKMGLPLCRPCPECQREDRGLGHVPADVYECTICGFTEDEFDEK